MLPGSSIATHPSSAPDYVVTGSGTDNVAATLGLDSYLQTGNAATTFGERRRHEEDLGCTSGGRRGTRDP
jgi:hypothetical protein